MRKIYPQFRNLHPVRFIIQYSQIPQCQISRQRGMERTKFTADLISVVRSINLQPALCEYLRLQTRNASAVRADLRSYFLAVRRRAHTAHPSIFPSPNFGRRHRLNLRRSNIKPSNLQLPTIYSQTLRTQMGKGTRAGRIRTLLMTALYQCLTSLALLVWTSTMRVWKIQQLLLIRHLQKLEVALPCQAFNPTSARPGGNHPI